MEPNIEAKKLKIAVVGCGRISQSHIQAILENEKSFKLTAICEPNDESRSLLAKKLNVSSYTSLDTLLSTEKLDLIALCTPSGIHSEQAMKIARNKIHVITEKPMATRWKDGLAMVRECDENGVKLFVVKQNRHNKTLRVLKQAVEAKHFGKIHLVLSLIHI